MLSLKGAMEQGAKTTSLLLLLLERGSSLSDDGIPSRSAGRELLGVASEEIVDCLEPVRPGCSQVVPKGSYAPLTATAAQQA